MEKEVLVHIRGLQMLDESGGHEPIEIVVPGEHYYRNGSHYIKYEEILDESGEPTTNYVKMSGDAMEVRKKGLVNVHMVFERGKKNMTYYSTPFGTIQMGIAATELKFNESDTDLDMQVSYALDFNDEHVADCHLGIFVERTLRADA